MGILICILCLLEQQVVSALELRTVSLCHHTTSPSFTNHVFVFCTFINSGQESPLQTASSKRMIPSPLATVCVVHFAGRIFPDFFPGTTTPCGEPGHRSGITGDVIHFNATQAVRMGYQYWDAYQSAMALTTVAPSAKTKACNASSSIALPERVIEKCGTMHGPEY